MEREELKNKIIEVIDQSKLGSVATIKDDKPWVRYMAIQHDEDLTLYTATFAGSRKVEQINKNNHVHVTIGGDSQNMQTAFVNIQANAQVLTDQEEKKKYWSEMLKNYFSGPEDPNYVLIKIVPEIVEYTAPGAHLPEVYKVN